MANKRMFSLSVVDTDYFLEMPISSRLLYYELGMRADDDGFVDNWKRILMFTGLKEDDLKVLISKQFILPFESGVIVIRHWRLNNYLQKDRIKPTIYQEEKKKLCVDNNNVYKMDTKCIHSIEENSIDKISIDSSNNSNNVHENIFEIIEKEFGRTLSPMEVELIQTWDYPIEILKIAIREASISCNYSIKYIDRIIYNWKKANIKSVNDVKEYIRKFNEKKRNRDNQPRKQAETIGADYYEEF